MRQREVVAHFPVMPSTARPWRSEPGPDAPTRCLPVALGLSLLLWLPIVAGLFFLFASR